MANETYPNQDFQKIYDSVLAAQGGAANTDFDSIYNSILASMGDDATLKANIAAALRPQYDKSIQELNQQRIERNAQIDVDAASRGMGSSTWVTDAKLRQMRGTESAIAGLESDYNAQLYNNLNNALKDRDDDARDQAMALYQIGLDRDKDAWNRAMQLYQIDLANKQKSGGRGGSGGSGSNGMPDWFKQYLASIDTPAINEVKTVPKPAQTKPGLNRAIINTWNLPLVPLHNIDLTK